MKRFLLCACLTVALALPVFTQETITLTTPQTVTTTTARVSYIGFDLENARIVVEVKNNLGVIIVTKTYDATTLPTGATLLNSINTANNTTTSLVKRVYQRLQTDGVIAAGTVVGAPQ